MPRRGKRGWPGPLVSFPSLGKKLAARRRRNSPAKRAIQRPDEGIGPYKKAFYHRPLIRPLRGHLSLSPLSLRDIIPTPFGLRPFPPDRGNRPLDKGSRPPGGRHDGRVRTPAPTGIVGKNSGRTMCAPTPYLRTALHIERGTDLGPVS